MAIDTATKRFAVMAFDAVGMGIHTLPVPDGTLEAGDRFHLLDTYDASSFAPSDVHGGEYIVILRRRRRPRV
jgi:hypothetical protein